MKSFLLKSPTRCLALRAIHTFVVWYSPYVIWYWTRFRPQRAYTRWIEKTIKLLNSIKMFWITVYVSAHASLPQIGTFTAQTKGNSSLNVFQNLYRHDNKDNAILYFQESLNKPGTHLSFEGDHLDVTKGTEWEHNGCGYWAILSNGWRNRWSGFCKRLSGSNEQTKRQQDVWLLLEQEFARQSYSSFQIIIYIFLTMGQVTWIMLVIRLAIDQTWISVLMSNVAGNPEPVVLADQ